MVAEILAGIALVKSATEVIKKSIDAAQSIGDIAGEIDKLFEGERQCQKKRNKKSGVSIRDQIGSGSAAQEVIDAKLAKEAMAEVRSLVTLRFGAETWQEIMDLQRQRIVEEKQLEAAERQAKAETKEMMRDVGALALAVVIGIVIIAIVVLVLMALR